MISIKGNYRKTIYSSSDGFTVGLFKVREIDSETYSSYKNKTITFTGYFHELNEEETYIFNGDFVEHPRYGFQFQVKTYERVKPQGTDGLIEFLASGLFKGVGEKTATKIVEVLGDKALDIILDNYESLLKVPGITKTKAIGIYNSLIEYEDSHKIITYLFELGFTTRDALIIYNEYKGETQYIIENNIYQLIEDINNINFIKVDSLRNRLGILPNDKRRVKASIIYVVNELCYRLGDTYLQKEEIIHYTNRCLNLELSSEEIEESLSELIEETKLILEDNRYYSVDLYESELNITYSFKYLLGIPSKKYKKITTHLEEIESSFNIKYNNKQVEAITKSIENNLLVITGGPGTGKTTIIKGIVELYLKLNNLNYDRLMDDIVLLAPTGRAAKRISESTLFPAVTIHRFLKWNKDNDSFGINEYNKSDVKFVIVDEASMIDNKLLDNLLKGLNSDVKLVLVGDYNQLPSVGPGQVLKDIIDSEIIDVIFLDTLYRQKETSSIISLAYDINNGEVNLNDYNDVSDFKFIECKPFDIKTKIKTICEERIKEGQDFNNIQIMAPIYRGENGIDNLNKMLRDIYNPKSNLKKEIRVGDVIYREQDKVMQLVNMVDENVFNGDIGIIERIVTDPKKEIYINFDGNIVKYTTSNFNDIKLGYAISIHKSQGNDFDVVIMPITTGYRNMLYRRLIYTGVTRAKKELIIIGENDAFSYGISNNEASIRKTSLKEMLVKIIIGS
ncbi:MAG: ATP-dependent RecD-like DNA helicase [Bacilli bacterium]|nr:ATP-dependent RecD-like DNA helicase [Bacilli bacterium]